MATFEESVKIRRQAEIKNGKSRMSFPLDRWVGPWEEAYKKLGRHEEFLEKLHWLAGSHGSVVDEMEWNRKVNLILAEFWINHDTVFPKKLL